MKNMYQGGGGGVGPFKNTRNFSKDFPLNFL